MNRIFSENAFDAVMHFAAVAYVGESTAEPLRSFYSSFVFFACYCICFLMFECRLSRCRYYHNITSNTMLVVKAMAAHGVKTLIYSSTCATYGEPETMPITEDTPQVSYNKWRCICFTDCLVFNCSDCRSLSIHTVKPRKWQRT